MQNVTESQQSAGTPSQRGKVWFITGASTGFGRVLAEYVAELGGNVVATARRRETVAELEAKYPAQVQAATLDVTDRAAIERAVADALARFEHIDVLVNNAGYGVFGALEEVNDAELMPMFNTNVFGLIDVTKAVLPHMRARRSGHIVNLSSIAGLVGGAGWTMYNATKFAVEGLSEGLAQEVRPLGISVTIVEPGPFRTDFLGRSGVQAAANLPDYAETVGKLREYFQNMNGNQPGDPRRAAEAIVKAVSSPKPPLRLLLGKVALTRFRARMDGVMSEIGEWEQTTTGADFPESQT